MSGNTSFKKSYSVKKLVAHKDFPMADIGLIKLNNKIEFNESVKSIKLTIEKDLDKVNYEAVLTGWGKLNVIIIIYATR